MTDGRAPDLVDALIGYRAWRLDPDGGLRPWTLSAAGAWAPGANTASCHLTRFDPTRKARRHRPPAPGCMCGLYALAALDDRRLVGKDGQAIGAVAAWGDIEVHRTGFRAEHAAVVALAHPDGEAPSGALRAAAARYGVPLVPRRELEVTAATHGAPLDPELVGDGGREHQHEERHVGDVGFALDEHVWVRPDAGSVDVGLTGAFWALLGDDVDLTLPGNGLDVAPGDVLAVAADGEGRSFLVWSCLNGTVIDAARGARGPDDWLVRLADTAWADDAGTFLWGRAGATNYAAHVASMREGVDVFAGLHGERLFSRPTVRSGRDVLRELARRKGLPRFVTAQDVYAACAPLVHERLARDPSAGARAARADTTIAYETTDPAAAFTLVAADGRVELRCGTAMPGAAITLRSSAEDAEHFFAGRLDVAQALRSGRLQSDRPAARVLPTLSLLKAVL